MLAELKLICDSHCKILHLEAVLLKAAIVLAAIQQCISHLASAHQLAEYHNQIKAKYNDFFKPIPHLNELPTDVYCRIHLKDANKQIQT